MKSIDPIESFVFSEYTEALNTFNRIRNGIKKLKLIFVQKELLLI